MLLSALYLWGSYPFHLEHSSHPSSQASCVWVIFNNLFEALSPPGNLLWTYRMVQIPFPSVTAHNTLDITVIIPHVHFSDWIFKTFLKKPLPLKFLNGATVGTEKFFCTEFKYLCVFRLPFMEYY